PPAYTHTFALSFYFYRALLHLHSFPTRRSSDLATSLELAASFLCASLDHSSRLFLLFKVPNLTPCFSANVFNVILDVSHSFLMRDRKSTRLNSSHVSISYAVFCLKKQKVKGYDL